MNQNETYLCSSANGKRIVYDAVGSHTATHFDDTPGLCELAVGILTGRDLHGPIVALDIDMGAPVGTSDVVEVDDSDTIVYAVRFRREDQGRVPFTKSRQAEPSSHVSVYLIEKDSDTYELASAWIGELESPPFPEMADAIPESKIYWSKHAFVWGSQKVIPETIVEHCPW